MYNFNPYLNYQQRLMQMEQQMPMQQMQQVQPIQTQMQAMFISGIEEMNKIQLMPNVLYIGINKASKEVYIKQMNNDGLTELNTYSLASEEKEKGTLEKILDRLDSLEKNLKGQTDERNFKSVNGAGSSRKASKSPDDGNVQSNDE